MSFNACCSEDADDAGPGFLAYDLCVLPWSYLSRNNLKELDDTLRERWAHYLRGYRMGGGAVMTLAGVSLAQLGTGWIFAA